MTSQPDDPNALLVHVLKHAAAAAVFFFVLQRFAMKETLEVSLLWAAFCAAAAALLAWQQARR